MRRKRTWTGSWSSITGRPTLRPSHPTTTTKTPAGRTLRDFPTGFRNVEFQKNEISQNLFYFLKVASARAVPDGGMSIRRKLKNGRRGIKIKDKNVSKRNSATTKSMERERKAAYIVSKKIISFSFIEEEKIFFIILPYNCVNRYRRIHPNQTTDHIFCRFCKSHLKS